MISNSLKQGLLVGITSAALAGCGGAGVPLAGNEQMNSKCPPNGCANLEPDQTQLTLVGPPGTQVHKAPAVSSGVIVDQVEFGGDCYASTYPNNRIEVTVVNKNNNAPVNVSVENNHIVSTVGSSNIPRCVKGRYGFAIYGNQLAANASYKVTARLIGIDSNGNEVESPGSGEFTTTLNRWAN